MAAFKIPERFKPGFAVLAGMPELSFAELLASARQAPKSFSDTRELEVWLASEVKSVPTSDLVKLVDSITSIYRLQSRYGMTTQQLAEDLAEGAQESIQSLVVAKDSDLGSRIAALLKVESFNIVSLKAKELQSQAERIFCEARVITDIRPVFSEENKSVPTTMFVVQTLKIVAHEGTSHKEYYWALDANDIASLILTLQRAEEKARTLKNVFEKAELRIIDLK